MNLGLGQRHHRLSVVGGQDSGNSEPPQDEPISSGVSMATQAELTEAQIAAAEARTDTKIVRLEGKLDIVLSKLDEVREDGRATRANMWVIGVSLALLIIGVVAAAPVIFDLGMKTREAISKEIHEKTTPATK
jgi:hypothetical protein